MTQLRLVSEFLVNVWFSETSLALIMTYAAYNTLRSCCKIARGFGLRLVALINCGWAPDLFLLTLHRVIASSRSGSLI